MATYRVSAFGSENRVWAIAKDGLRIVVFEGQDAGTLKSEIIFPKNTDEASLDEEVRWRQAQVVNKGMAPLGECLVDNGELKSLNQEEPVTRFLPTAYVSMLFKGKTNLLPLIEALRPLGPTLSEDEKLLTLQLPNNTQLIWRNGESTFSAKKEHGAYGRLAVLAAAKVLKEEAFDADGNVVDSRWINTNPELFRNEPDWRELAEELGLVMRIPKPKAGASPSLAMF